ncbi:MAG: hypothetical protein ACTHOH_11000, partial [Lysobacteraceae bacterium]
MSAPVDPWQSPKSRQHQVSVWAMGKLSSPLRYLATLWSVQLLQLALIMTSRYWIDPMPLRLAFVVVVIAAPMRWMKKRGPPSVQLRWQTGAGARLSGTFVQRDVPLPQAVIAESVTIDGERLVFGLATPGAAGGALSLETSAFRTIAERDIRDLFAAALVGDAAGLAAIAEANGLKPRKRPGLISVSIVEDRAIMMIGLAGMLGIL